MKRCELCKSVAKVYCDSDLASLCWSCDAKVHSANFLVAKHSRSLLCQICQSPTLWCASGEKLSPSTASICGRCVVEGTSDDEDGGEERVGHNHEYDGGEYGDEEVSVDEIDNRVVPSSSTLPPSESSSSSCVEFSIADEDVSLKRKRQNVADLTSEDDLDTIDETSLLLTLSSSGATTGKLKRIRQHNINSGDHACAPVNCTSKSRRTADFDLNLSYVG